jgi:biofilm PGA synthesis protein PgaD
MNRRTKPRYKLILNMPDLVARHTKIGSSVFTVVFWGIFVYLWMPLITVVAWMLGLYHSYGELTYVRELSNLEHLAFIYAMIVLALGSSLLLWALQEYLRFRNVNRRREPVAVALHELASYVNFQESDIATHQLARRLVVQHGVDGSVMRIS